MREPLLITMNGPDSVQVENLSNFEAGVLFLSLVNATYPGIKLSEMMQLSTMEPVVMGRTFLERQLGNLSKAGTKLGNALVSTTGNIKDGIGDVLKDSVNLIGTVGGSAVRLAADPAVSDLAIRAGSAYATGGGSEGVKGVIEQMTGGKNPNGKPNSLADGIMDWISGLGQTTKSTVKDSKSSTPTWLVPVGIGGAVILAIALMRKK